MSITAETAKAHANDPAVVCCRCEEGTKLEASNFEDPAIFPDLIDTGLLNVDGALTIGQVIGVSTLTKTIDSLTPITADIVDKYSDGSDADGAADESEGAAAGEDNAETAVPVIGGTTSGVTMTTYGGVLKLHIGEGKDIDIELPL